MSQIEDYPYQLKGVRKIQHFLGISLLSDEVGLGKSRQALRWYEENIPEAKLLIVCPKSIKRNWRREVKKHIGKKSGILSTTQPVSLRETQAKILIINYDVLEPWLPFLLEWKPDLLIADEIHYAKSRKAKRTKCLRAIARKCRYRIFLSGTPLTNRPAELWPALNMLRPDKYTSFFSFAQNYCNPKRNPWGWDYSGASNLDELHKELLATCMIRRRKIDVLDQLPERRRIVVPLEITNQEEYEEAEKDFLIWLRKTFGGTRADSAARAERLVQMGYMMRLTAKLKLPAVKDWINDFLTGSGSKLITFGTHKFVLHQLHESFQKSVLVTGETSDRERNLAFDRFNTDKNFDLFLGNIKAAGTGWSCTSADDNAFVEFGWVPGDLTQAEGRPHGVGRGTGKSVTTSYYLVAEGTIEEELCKILQRKQRVLDTTLDGKPTEEGINIYDELTQALLGRE